jgi:hypothetical protein
MLEKKTNELEMVAKQMESIKHASKTASSSLLLLIATETTCIESKNRGGTARLTMTCLQDPSHFCGSRFRTFVSVLPGQLSASDDDCFWENCRSTKPFLTWAHLSLSTDLNTLDGPEQS